MTSERKLRIGWKNANVTLAARLVPRFAFMTASIAVFLDDRSILETGGVLKLVGSQIQNFEHDGQLHSVELSWGTAKLRSFPVTLAIDGESILETSVEMSNWWLAYWPWLALLGVVAWNFY